MQYRTVDNALNALRREGVPQGKIAEALPGMRGVRLSLLKMVRQARRGQTSSYVLRASSIEPMAIRQISDMFGAERPDLTPKQACQRFQRVAAA